MARRRPRAEKKGRILVHVSGNGTEHEGFYFRARTWQPHPFNPARLISAASWPHSIPQDMAFPLSPTNGTDPQRRASPTAIPIPLIDLARLEGSRNTSPEHRPWPDAAPELGDDEIFYPFDG
jgi:hypothetical protein